MSLYTRWACFDCRKSFAKDARETPRKCPECAKAMIDMGAYFEPPRRLSKKRWEVMKVLADYGYRFNDKDSRIYIQNRILQAKNPRVVDVVERIEAERQRKKESAAEHTEGNKENETTD
jgi:DNA-directed RNA polymerase subunit RPC12/RpoP